ncbi:MAG: energy transducer TonB [Rhodocyclales bacterium CG17_big_fil_post_rev_8_21_14_2_50_68_7]|nr:MAG: energy transducer TonB [Rhodocyclales bacterium CG17_big_fil_post_rev_8_21_14_2_50_68_7]
MIASLVLHAVVLSIRFRLPDIALAKMRDPQLEVVLVNSKSATKPDIPQARAQANLDGGGNENRRPKTPLPALRAPASGTEPVEARQRAQVEETPPPVLSARSDSREALPERPRSAEQPEPAERVSGADLARSALAMARLEAEISRMTEEYGKRPRRKFVGARVTEAVEAQYVEDWRQKVERVGNLNYPESARGRLYGSLVMSVGIRADGSIDTLELHRSSGHPVLDQAAQRIVRLAAPYGVFPPALRRNVDILVITRTWTFTSADRLASE